MFHFNLNSVTLPSLSWPKKHLLALAQGQFPKRYVPGLGVGRPWRSFPTETVSASWMLPAFQALRAAVPELLLEYLELKEAGQMYREKDRLG